MKTLLRRASSRTEMLNIDTLSTAKRAARERQPCKRAAYAQPRVLFSATALVAGAWVWWAMAQNTGTSQGKGTVSAKTTSTTAAPSASKLTGDWSNLPKIMANYVERRRIARMTGAADPATLSDNTKDTIAVSAGGVGAKRFSLTEGDLTPGNNSDERDPVYSPDGNFIAFASTGVDSDGNGKIDGRNANGTNGTPRYHIWIMNRDGSNQRQLSGLVSSGPALDSAYNQREPAFSVDGNTIVFVNRVLTTAGLPADQLFTVSSLFTTPVVNQLTSFPLFPNNRTRELRSPNFSAAGAIAFASNFDPTNGYNFPVITQTSAPGFELFLLTPVNGNLRRLTGPEYNGTDRQTDDLNPAFVPGNANILFFSTNLDSETGTPQVLTVGRRIWALNVNNAKVRQQVTRPIKRPKGRASDSDDFPTFVRRFTGATNNSLSLVFQTDSFIDTSDTVNDTNIWSLALPPTFSAIGQVIAEADGPAANRRPLAIVESNRLSSTAGAAFPTATPGVTPTPLFPGATQDVVGDREPGGVQLSSNLNGGGVTSGNVATTVVFASQRRSAAAPGSTPNDPSNLPVLNPDGGRFDSTHDIWTTVTEDLQPPLLVPVGSGGQLSPFFAPGTVALQAGLNAPRTPDDPNGGLQPGGIVRVAVVLQDQESGLIGGNAFVRVAVKRADQPVFTPKSPVAVLTLDEVQPTLLVDCQQESSPTSAAAVDLTPYDDGPLAQGGHERQNNAVRGDGIYYCEGQFTASPTAGDFYMDLQTRDASGNALTYDNVWGFSTLRFNQRQNNILFVSDYTVGQRFPFTLAGANGSAPRSNYAVEAVEGGFLENRVGPAFNGTLAPSDQYQITSGPASRPSLPLARDVWRILSRGPIPQNTINAYSPTVVTQLDPTLFLDANNNPNPALVLTPTRLQTVNATAKRQLSNAQSFVVWDAPYTGTVFVGPGSFIDVTAQTTLTNFLNLGGRLFLSGNDIEYALANGQVGGTNTFLTDELRANFGGEITSPNFGFTMNNVNGEGFISGRSVDGEPPDVIHIGFQDPITSSTFADSASNARRSGMDIITPLAATGTDQTVVPIYGYGTGGQVSAQRIERRNRQEGFESRVVFFAFGFENIHREYRFAAVPRPDRCVNFRSKITDNVRNYFITGGIAGNIKNNNNANIANFLVVVTNQANPALVYVALTDTNGNYSLQGLPTGTYTVQPAQYTDTSVTPNVVRSFNGPYFPSASVGVGVSNGNVTSGVNFRIQIIAPGGIVGQAYGDNATPNNTGDDVRFAQNVPVLVRSVSTNLPPTPNFPSGGSYAALTQTGIDGTFTLPNLPGEITYLVIFNPIPGTFQQGGDTPDNTGIVYPSDTIKPNPNYGRRVIPVDPDNRTPYPNFTGPGVVGTAISVPTGTTINLGKVAVPEGSTIPTATPRPGPTATPIPGATATPVPLPSSGSFAPGSLYAISFPYTDNVAETDTASLTKVLTLPPTTGTTTNYQISRYDPITQQYVALSSTGEPIVRGQGYFLSPNVLVRIKSPTDDATLVPLPTTTQTFKVTLRRGTNNGLNLVGFPFNPSAYSTINWPECPVQVVNSDGTSTFYASVTQAAGANVMSATVKAYDPTAGAFTEVTALKPFGGYFATVNKDNVIVTLIARQ